jgi:hypothetical protein
MFANNEKSSDADRNDGQYGSSTYDPDSRPWVDVARVANLAEAGFIVDELIGLGFQARVHQIDDFRAATDRWSAQYLIRVPEEFAEAAAEHIGQYLSEEPVGRTTMFQKLRESVRNVPQEQSPSWRPVAVIMLVGVTSFLLGHQYSDHAAPRQPSFTDLSTAIARVGRAFSSEPAANQPRYQLSFDQRQQLWTLGADRDHDGVVESSQHFTASGAAR